MRVKGLIRGTPRLFDGASAKSLPGPRRLLQALMPWTEPRAFTHGDDATRPLEQRPGDGAGAQAPSPMAGRRWPPGGVPRSRPRGTRRHRSDEGGRLDLRLQGTHGPRQAGDPMSAGLGRRAVGGPLPGISQCRPGRKADATSTCSISSPIGCRGKATSRRRGSSRRSRPSMSGNSVAFVAWARRSKRGTGLLNNVLYRGDLVWNRCSYIKDPRTGKRVARPNPPEKWETLSVPELRIVSDDLWAAVKTRQASLSAAYASSSGERKRQRSNPLNTSHRPRFLLSGLLRCGCCGGGFTIVAKDRYGCATRKQKGTCQNNRTILQTGDRCSRPRRA